jgi:hypothetical protein
VRARLTAQHLRDHRPQQQCRGDHEVDRDNEILVDERPKHWVGLVIDNSSEIDEGLRDDG